MSTKLTDEEWAEIEKNFNEAEEDPTATLEDPAWRRFWEPLVSAPIDADLRPDLPEGQEPAADFLPRVPAEV